MAFRHAEKTDQGQAVAIAQVKSMSKVLNDTFVNYFQLGMVGKDRATRFQVQLQKLRPIWRKANNTGNGVISSSTPIRRWKKQSELLALVPR